MSEGTLKRSVKRLVYPAQYLSWLYRYLKLKFGFNVLGDIKILSVEFSSVCNLRCKYCFLDQLDRERFLDIDVYEKLIKEVAENPRYNVRVMEWPISGEFFVYPKFREVIAITKKHWDANPRFRPHIILNENLVLLDDEKIDLILGSGIVGQIICSIDGHDAQTFEDMRPPGKFDKLVRNMNLLVEKNRNMKKPVFLQVNNGRDERSAAKPYSGDMARLLKMGDSVTQWQPEFWNESFNKPEKKYIPAKGFCTFVFNNVTLSSSGEVSKCCMDLRGATTYADLRHHTLEEIWHSDARKRYMTDMFRNNRSKIKGCSSCAITNVNNDNRYTSVVRTAKRRLLPIIKGKEYFLKPLDSSGTNGKP